MDLYRLMQHSRRPSSVVLLPQSVEHSLSAVSDSRTSILAYPHRRDTHPCLCASPIQSSYSTVVHATPAAQQKRLGHLFFLGLVQKTWIEKLQFVFQIVLE